MGASQLTPDHKKGISPEDEIWNQGHSFPDPLRSRAGALRQLVEWDGLFLQPWRLPFRTLRDALSAAGFVRLHGGAVSESASRRAGSDRFHRRKRQEHG